MLPTIHRLSPGTLEVDLTGVNTNWHQDFLVISDVHWDSPHCRRDLLKKHFDQAVERKAGIFIFGDFWDAMQGKKDPRSRKTDIRPEHQGDNYFDLLTQTATEFLQPYAENILIMGMGNHELSVMRHHEINLCDRLVHNLRTNVPSCTAIATGYRGWVFFKVSGKDKNIRWKKTRLFYSHGSGGSSPVTRGTIKQNRRATYLPDADIVCSGHIHEDYGGKINRSRVTDRGLEYEDFQTHFQLGTYKQEIDEEGLGWKSEREFHPTANGGKWLHFEYRRYRLSRMTLQHEVRDTHG